MAEVLLLHHALGRTPGCLAFAAELRAAGHVVHVPDLYEGRTFGALQEGVAFAQEIGFDEIARRGAAAADSLAAELVYLGFSLGVLPAQRLAQTRPGARAAILCHAAIGAGEFGAWPPGVRLQLHFMEGDRLAAEEGDLDAARALRDTVDGAELHLYPGDGHLFAEPAVAEYDAAAAALLRERVLRFLSATETR
jgi:dienelactone hydrolase